MDENGNNNNKINQSNNSIEEKPNKRGLLIPEKLPFSANVKTPPTWIRIHRNMAYISGHGPQNPDGSVAGPFWKVGEELAVSELSIDQAYNSAKLAGLSILGTLKRELGSLDKVTAWLQVRVMINTVPKFYKNNCCS